MSVAGHRHVWHHGARIRGDRLRAPQLERALDRAEVLARLGQSLRALVAEDRLELLDRVLLDARAERLTGDDVEIHEQAAPEHAIDLGLSRGVAAHEALQRAGLVRGEGLDDFGGWWYLVSPAGAQIVGASGSTTPGYGG